MKIDVYNLKGEKTGDIKLADNVFGMKSNNELLHQVYVSLASNKRQSTAHTKDKGERKGSGRKPWKQKGTGNARTGTVRNPIWRKGGVIFGPTKNRNFKKKINIKMKRKAIKLALTEKAKAGDMVIIDRVEFGDKKTKQVAKALKFLNLTKKVLFNLSGKEKELHQYIRNIANVKSIEIEKLNVYDMLNYKKIIISKKGIKFLEKKYE